MPYKDLTSKTIITDVPSIQKLLEDHGYRYIGLDHQVDTYYEVEKGKLKWRNGTIEKLITHYERFDHEGVEETMVYRYDVNPTQDDINDLVRSHKQIGIIEKDRHIYRKGQHIKIHLDVINNQSFLEIEVYDHGDKLSHKELSLLIDDVKLQLDLDHEKQIKTGYFLS